MSSKDRAQVEAELTGAPKVEASAKQINKALGDVKKTAGEGISASVNKSTASLQVMGAKADALRSALSPQAILGGFVGGMVAQGLSSVVSYLNEASNAAQALGEHTSGVARRAGVDMGSLSKMTAEQARHSTQGADAGLDFVDAVNQISYGGKGAAESLREVENVATMLGRSDKDLAPFIASLQKMYGLNVDVGREMNALIEKAQRLHTIGGAQALIDSVAGLGALGQVSHQGEAAKDKVLAFRAVAGKTLNPDEANALTDRMVGFVKGNANKIAMTPGLGLKYGDIIDPKTGQVRDPVATMQAVQKWAATKGRTPEERNFRLGNTFGPEALPLFGFDYGEVTREADPRTKAARAKAAAIEAARKEEAYRNSPEGIEALQKQRSKRRDEAIGEPFRVLSRKVSGAAGWLADQTLDALTMGSYTGGGGGGDLSKKLDENTAALKANTEAIKPGAGVSLTVKKKPAGNH